MTYHEKEVNPMTNRELYTATINYLNGARDVDTVELCEGFESLIAKLDATNEKRKAASAVKAAEKQAEKAPIRNALLEVLNDEPATATELIAAAGLDIKPASVPSLLRPFVESGDVVKVEKKIEGKGKQRAYVRG